MTQRAKARRKSNRRGAAIRLNRFIPYRMSLLVHRLTLANSELYTAHHRLSVQEWRVLSIIADSGPLVPAEIRRMGTQDKSTISWAIKRLQHRGFLSRQPRPHDARTFEVLLSDQGWRYYRSVAPIARRKAGVVLQKLTRAERNELHRILTKLDATSARDKNHDRRKHVTMGGAK
jgi:DNA-binding MarR family transcriptional regulator